MPSLPPVFGAGAAADCPCGSGASLASCCAPYLQRTAQPPTAEALMRSRYTAFAVGDTEHLWRTWHPRTRPDEVEDAPGLTWTELDVTGTSEGGPDDETGEVSYVARFTTPNGPGSLSERSRFERRGGRWVYVDGDHLD